MMVRFGHKPYPTVTDLLVL